MKIYIVRRDEDTGDGIDTSISAVFTSERKAKTWLGLAVSENQKADALLEAEETRWRNTDAFKVSDDFRTYNAGLDENRAICSAIMKDLQDKLGGSYVGWTPEPEAYSIEIVETGVPVVDRRSEE